jgi:RNA polymerase sigma factor (sigma-70 family)
MKSGDEDAGAYLVSLCGGRLAGYIAMIARDLGQADREIVAELTVERALRDIDTFDSSRGSLDAWMRGYARYLVMEQRRKTVGAATAPDELPEMPLGEPEGGPPGGPLIEAVSTAIGKLSVTDQMMIRLREYEQLSYDEIAAQLNVRPTACRKRHERALSRLRQYIEEEAGSDGPLSEALK